MRKSDKSRIERIYRLGCCACASIGVPNYHMIEIHHLLSGGERLGDRWTIPLCKGHHQGYFTATQIVLLPEEHRAAIGKGRKPFIKAFGTERKLLEKVDFVLGLETPWPKSKIVAGNAA